MCTTSTAERVSVVKSQKEHQPPPLSSSYDKPDKKEAVTQHLRRFNKTD